MKDLLQLNKFITPGVITIIYWLLLIVVVIGSLMQMFGMAGPFSRGFTFGGFITGVVFLVVGTVMVRVWCELVIVFFKINENLEEIKKK